MKYITELNEKEILELTQEELDRMVKWKMAQEGLKFYLKPEEPTYHKLPEPDIEVFKIDSVSFEFLTEDTALEVAKVLRTNASKILNYTYGNGVIDFLSDFEKNSLGQISTTKKYSKELWNKISELKKENDINKENYEDRLRDFDSAYKEAEYIREEVFGKFSEVVKKYSDFKIALTNFLSYFEIANQDFEQAMKFFEKAYTPDVETIAYISANYNQVLNS